MNQRQLPESAVEANLWDEAGAGVEGPGESRDGAATRRKFVGGSVIAGMAALASHLTGRAAQAKTASLPQLYTGQNAAYFKEIQSDENAHAAFYQNALGSAAVPIPTFNTTALTASTVQQFVAMSVMFENTGARAYPTAAIYIDNPAYLSIAARIGAVEAYHSGFLNALSNGPLVYQGNPFLFSSFLYPPEVDQAISPFISSLNGGPTPGYTLDVRSPQNDLAILNFAYVLELLEQTFYNINVPRFFR